MVELGWCLISLIVVLADVCYGFEFGSDDWTWPESSWDGLASGYGHPGWEPLTDHLLIPDIATPFEPSITHNHFHHIVGQGGPALGDALINDQHYQHFPSGHHPHHHGHHHHPTRDWYCHHAKRAKGLKKWLKKMLFCSLI